MAISGSTTLSWPDEEKRATLIWKHPRNIHLNDNIVVREDEIAVFFRDGKVLTVFDRADRYALTSMNTPVVGKLLKFFTGVQQEASVYYVQRRVFDARFGTLQPMMFKDARFGMVSLRAFGEFRYKVSDPTRLITQFVGTMNATGQEYVSGRISERVVMALNQSLGEFKKGGNTVADIPENLSNIEQLVLAKCPQFFDEYGLAIMQISGLSINLPEEVRAKVDDAASDRASASLFDDDSMAKFSQYQRVKAMRDAANNEGGAAGIGVGLGAGLALGKEMVEQVATAKSGGSKSCNSCGQSLKAGAKFCPECGAGQGARACKKCKAENPAGAKFCADCGSKL